jgi:hypothetical protein
LLFPSSLSSWFFRVRTRKTTSNPRFWPWKLGFDP